MKVEIKNYHMVFHLNMGKFHSAKHVGTVVAPGNEIDGKELVVESHTRMKGMGVGKTTYAYYLNEKDSPIFDTPEQFCEHYKLENSK